MLGILGGGLSGLSLAHLIPDSQILEKSSRPGGLMQSITENGFTFDLSGGHILFSKNKEVMLMMLSVLGENVCQRTRNTKISYGNQLIKYPFENGLSDLSKEENFECVSDFIKAQMHPRHPAYDFSEYLRRTYGNAISEKYLIPYNEKIWKYPLNKMSADWCPERMPQPTIDAVLKASLGLKSEGYTHQLHFYYPRVGGIEAFITALAKGKNISCNKEVTHIEKVSDKWHVEMKYGDYRIYEKYDGIVSTIPLPNLISCLDDVPAKVKTAVSHLKYNSLITVMIGVDHPVSPYSWIYYPEKEIYHRMNLVSNFSDHVAPDGHGAMIMEITCHEDDKIYNLPDEEIYDMIFDRHSTIVYSRVHRTKYAYVIYDQDYNKNISIIRSFLKERGIKTLGRFAEWEYYNMDHCIEKAMAMAERIKYKL